MHQHLPRSYAPRDASCVVNPAALMDDGGETLLCFSHLRWNFVFQRPQHLMNRFAGEMNVIFWEEPVSIAPNGTAFLQVRRSEDSDNVLIVVPHLPEGMPEHAREATLKRPDDEHRMPLQSFGGMDCR